MATTMRHVTRLVRLVTASRSGAWRPALEPASPKWPPGAMCGFPGVAERWMSTKKSKAKAKSGGGGGAARVSMPPELVDNVIDLEGVRGEMDAALASLREDLLKGVSLRTAPGALDHIAVVTAEGRVPLKQIGHVTVRSPSLLVVNMAACPQATEAAVQAIRTSGMNLNPEVDGDIIRVPVPKVTREHRENLARVAKQLGTRCKDALRSVRNAAVTRARRARDSVSDDVIRLVEKQIQQMADETSDEVDRLVVAKTKELLG
ncbi:ribosome-recycling factor, mitochondrial [Lampetra fluviatilis]